MINNYVYAKTEAQKTRTSLLLKRVSVRFITTLPWRRHRLGDSMLVACEWAELPL